MLLWIICGASTLSHWSSGCTLVFCVHIKTAGVGSKDALFRCQCTFYLWGAENKDCCFYFILSSKLNTWALYNWTGYISIYSIPSQLFFALEGLCDCFSSSYLFTTFPPTISQAPNRSLMYPSVNSWKVSMAFWSISAPRCVSARRCGSRRLVEAVRVEYLIGRSRALANIIDSCMSIAKARLPHFQQHCTQFKNSMFT